jgi:sec-independent protein translocase protein TatB
MSFTEVVVIAALALILLGPDQLPQAAKSFGKLLRDLRKASDDLKEQIGSEINLGEVTRLGNQVSRLGDHLGDQIARLGEPSSRPALVAPVPASPLPVAPAPEAATAEPLPPDLPTASAAPGDAAPAGPSAAPADPWPPT